METGKIKTNGVELFYEVRGPKEGTPVVFVMGLAAQMVFWPEPLLDSLAENGFRVIRFDNRDIGYSTLLREKIPYTPWAMMARFMTGLPIQAPYTLHDMVADTDGLIQGLGYERVHLVGASMGGMIGQLMAGTRPERVLSLTSIMSSNNGRFLPPPKLPALKSLVGPRKRLRDVDEYIEFCFDTLSRISGKLKQDKAMMREQYRQAWERGLHPRGVLQQFSAIMATGPLTPYLKKIRCPVTVIHGTDDPLIRPAGGRASARHIPGARLELIKGMGHDFPAAALEPMAALIQETVTAVEADQAPSPA